MSSIPIQALLAIITLGAVVVFAIISARKARQRKNNPEAPGSTLAAGTPDSRE